MILEVDPETAMVEIKRYLVVHDCGTIINPMLVEGQIHGGVAQGIGNAFYEQLVYDEQGQLLNASFMDYLTPDRDRCAADRNSAPRDAVAVQSRGPEGRRRSRLHSDWGAVCAGGRRCAGRNRRGDHGDSVEPEQAVRAHRSGGESEMILTGTFTFNGPRTKVWEMLQDPDVLAKALPGTKTLTLVGEDRYQGVMKVSVGPVTAAEFAVNVELKDKVAPETFSMHIDGKGGVGFTKGTATIELREEPGPVTVMTYQSDVQIGGKIAAVGQRLLESVGKMMTKQALEALNKELQSRL